MMSRAPTSRKLVTPRGWRAVAAIVSATVLLVPAAAWAGSSPFEASFRGTFRISFATGLLGTDELFFSGTGSATHVGAAAIDGYSLVREDPTHPGCRRIVHDETTITAANGDELLFVNEGLDCADFSNPFRIEINGDAEYETVGGTERFDGATGEGDVVVHAVVEELTPTGASGTFDVLTFQGTIGGNDQ